MTANRGIITIGLTVSASLIAIAACGPNSNNRVAIGQHTGGNVANSCAAKLSHYSSKIDEKATVKGKAPTVLMCQAEDVDPAGYAKPNGNASKPTARPTYKPKTSNVRYTVGNVDQNLAITLNLGLLFPDGTPKETSDAAISKISAYCIEPLQKSWNASQNIVSLNVLVEAVGDKSNYDQTIELVASEQDLALASHPLFVLGARPDRGQLVPNPVQTEECKKSADCRLALPASVNARFCASFDLLVVEYLGLQSQESKNDACKAPDAPAAGDAIIPTGFMDAEGLQTDPAQFWKRARFSKDDMKTILSTACDGNPAQSPVKTPAKDTTDAGI